MSKQVVEKGGIKGEVLSLAKSIFTTFYNSNRCNERKFDENLPKVALADTGLNEPKKEKLKQEKGHKGNTEGNDEAARDDANEHNDKIQVKGKEKIS